MGKEDASSIKHWPEDERPRERLVKFGGDALSDAHLLAPEPIRMASKIVLVHNHPSGDPSPSQADIEITHRVSKAGEIIGIKLLDHIIIGGTEFYSFADEGMI